MNRFNYYPSFIHSLAPTPRRSHGARLVRFPLLILPNRKTLRPRTLVKKAWNREDEKRTPRNRPTEQVAAGVRLCEEIIQSLKLALPGAKLVRRRARMDRR